MCDIITVYFAQNGNVNSPPCKVTVPMKKFRNNELVRKIGRYFVFDGKIIHKPNGKLLIDRTQIKNNSLFVLVAPRKCFIPGPYTTMFNHFQDYYEAQKFKVPKEVGFRDNIPGLTIEKSCSCKYPADLPADSKMRKAHPEEVNNMNICACQLSKSQMKLLKKPLTAEKKKSGSAGGGGGGCGSSCCSKKSVGDEFVITPHSCLEVTRDPVLADKILRKQSEIATSYEPMFYKKKKKPITINCSQTSRKDFKVLKCVNRGKRNCFQKFLDCVTCR